MSTILKTNPKEAEVGDQKNKLRLENCNTACEISCGIFYAFSKSFNRVYVFLCVNGESGGNHIADIVRCVVSSLCNPPQPTNSQTGETNSGNNSRPDKIQFNKNSPRDFNYLVCKEQAALDLLQGVEVAVLSLIQVLLRVKKENQR